MFSHIAGIGHIILPITKSNYIYMISTYLSRITRSTPALRMYSRFFTHSENSICTFHASSASHYHKMNMRCICTIVGIICNPFTYCIKLFVFCHIIGYYFRDNIIIHFIDKWFSIVNHFHIYVLNIIITNNPYNCFSFIG